MDRWVNTEIIRHALIASGIKHREIILADGVLYLCKTLYGKTFNLQLRNNQSIKIWSFIGSAPIYRAGAKYKWKGKNNSYPIGGIEITDDGDLSFYMIEALNFNETTDKNKIQDLITTYLHIINHIVFESLQL